MRIDIIVTRDDGSTITIATNQQIVADGPRCWHSRPDSKAIRSLTQDEAWAASFLCAEVGMRYLPISTANLSHLKAAAIYNEPTLGEIGEQDEHGRITARAKYKAPQTLSAG